jgi:glycosyltransferase involved in cell wall biosynthesis
MLVSIVIPACDAQSCIGRAVRSLIVQDWPQWEAIIVADDLFDYAAMFAAQNLRDPRLTFVSTGRRRSGCHHARNIGLSAASGELIGALDADDAFHPQRLATLAPVAAEHGAAADNLLVVADKDGSVMYPVMGHLTAPVSLGIDAFMSLTAPVVPLIRREHAQPRVEGVEYAEDVIANLRLIDRLGSLLVTPATHYEYRIRAGSIANDDRAGAEFERAYTDYIERLATGDGFGISATNRAVARAGLIRKRTLNRAFQAAWQSDRTLNFQAFVARGKGGYAWPPKCGFGPC